MTKGFCASCRAPILWAKTPNGKQMPLDPNPYTIAVFGDPSISPGGLTTSVGAGEPINRFVRGFNSHFASCPSASKHRRGR